MNLSVLAANCCDKALSCFKCLLDNDLKELRRDAVKFVQEDERLDKFYFKKLNAEKYTELSFVIRFILALSHGQASVEPGFNLNNAVMKTNMSPNSIIAKHIIKYHMLSNDLAPHNIIVSPAMIKSFRFACQKYYIHLGEEKKNKVKSEMEMRARLITDDNDKIKLQQKDLSKAIAMIETESNECMQLAEKKEDLHYVIKGNA